MKKDSELESVNFIFEYADSARDNLSKITVFGFSIGIYRNTGKSAIMCIL